MADLDVPRRYLGAVGGIERKPTKARNRGLEPSVRLHACNSAILDLFAGGVIVREQITRYVTRGDQNAPTERHGKVRVVLAYALASRQDIFHADADGGRTWCVAQPCADEAVQRENGTNDVGTIELAQALGLGEDAVTPLGVSRGREVLGVQVDKRRVSEILERWRGDDGPPSPGLDCSFGHDLEHVVWFAHADRVDTRTPVVGECKRAGRRRHAHAISDELLTVVARRARAQLVVRLAHECVVEKRGAISHVESHLDQTIASPGSTNCDCKEYSLPTRKY